MFRVVYDDGTPERQRDKLGRIVYKEETIQGEVHEYRYEYDGAGRLTDVCVDEDLDGIFTHYSHYVYDDNGNRTRYQRCGGACNPGNLCEQVLEEKYGSYDAPQDRLLSYGNASSTSSFTYTANGELKTMSNNEGVTEYVYDSFGNLLDVYLPGGGSVHYIIDGRGRRIGREVYDSQGARTEKQGFFYLYQLNPIAELDAAGEIVSVFVYAMKPNVPDLMLSLKYPCETDPSRICVSTDTFYKYRIISDHLGSVRLVVSLDSVTFGEVAQRMDYDEYGVVLRDTRAGFQPLGFGGSVYDGLSLLTRFGARDYLSGPHFSDQGLR